MGGSWWIGLMWRIRVFGVALATFLYWKSKTKIDNKKIKLHLLGLESKNDMYVCFLEIENLESFTKLSLENKILFEIFKDQQNIIHVKKNSKKRSFISRINNSVLSVNI